MATLCCIQFTVKSSDTTFYQYYVVDNYELKALRNLYYTFESECCDNNQSMCFGCKVGKFRAQYYDSIPISERVGDFFNTIKIKSLSELLDVVECSSSDSEIGKSNDAEFEDYGDSELDRSNDNQSQENELFV